MVNSVGASGGYQSYAYQQQTNPVQEQPRGGENRVEKREAPAADTQRGDQRSLASRDEDNTPRSRANDDTSSQGNRDTGTRGQTLDVTV
ncbi:MAG: hypothetical protein H3C49_10565 [Alphaproteobacteria bacterium]|nr:hypothetical protein [Alphaproteobacteria bacterium]HRI75356.1 hypothetical protein [Alphaproteobacteria bacterium]